MKTDYRAHDAIYRERRAQGHPGWQDEATLRETLTTLEEELDSPHAPVGGKVLELGCGAGDFALHLAEKGFEVHGVDLSSIAIEWARKKAQERGLPVSFRQGDVLTLESYGDNEFDFVIDGHCFHCIIGCDRRAFLASAHRVLKPGGRLHIATMCGEVSPEQLSARYDPASRCTVNDQGIATRYLGLSDTIVEEVAEADFEVLAWRVKEKTQERDDMDELLLWAAARK